MNEPTIVLPVFCEDEECGMYSTYKFWADGSFIKIVDGCHHGKKLPKRAEILEEMAENNLTQTAS